MKIILPWLYVGGLRDTYETGLLKEYGIGAMLQIAAPVPQDEIESFYLPLEDGVPITERSFAQAVGFVKAQRAAEKTVLIACAMGISRSVTLAIAAVKEIEDMTLAEALGIVRVAHEAARPHPVLWKSLCQRYGETIPYSTVLRDDGNPIRRF